MQLYLLLALTLPDFVCHRPHFDHRIAEDFCVLRQEGKDQRHRCFLCWYPPYLVPLAPDRISRRTLRHIRPFR